MPRDARSIEVALKGAGLTRGIKYSYIVTALARKSLVKRQLLPVTWYKIILEFQ